MIMIISFIWIENQNRSLRGWLKRDALLWWSGQRLEIELIFEGSNSPNHRHCLVVCANKKEFPNVYENRTPAIAYTKVPS